MKITKVSKSMQHYFWNTNGNEFKMHNKVKLTTHILNFPSFYIYFLLVINCTIFIREPYLSIVSNNNFVF